MYKSETNRVVRIGASAFIALALAVGTSGVAFADGSHPGGNSHQGNTNNGHHGDIDAIVTGLGTNSFTAQFGSAAPVVFTTTSATTYFEGSTAVTSSALAVGQQIDFGLTNTSPQTVAKVSIDVATFEGKVTVVAGNVVTITGPQSTTRNVNLTSTTTYSQGGTASTQSAIVVGSEIGARGLLGSTPGSITALSVKIAAPRIHFGGVVTALGINSFTIQNGTAAPVVYTTTSATTYFEGSTAVTSSALAVGQKLDVTLTSTTPQTVAKVSIDLVTFEGKVTVVTGNVITITGPKSTTRTVNVTSTTTYTQGGTASTQGAIVVGSKIEARGVLGSTPGTLTALSVKIAKVHTEGQKSNSNSNGGVGGKSGHHNHSRHDGR
jgi:hypothetical protein